MSRVEHPVREIVLPLAVVIGLIVNALMIGIAWGKFTYRMEISERAIQTGADHDKEQDRSIQALKDRTHDLERDGKEDLRRFLLLDDYTSPFAFRPPSISLSFHFHFI